MSKRKVPKNNTYDVGYKKPPAVHQFPAGKSGNPKGRPKGSKGLTAIVREELDRRLPVTSGGVVRTVFTRRIVAKSAVREAMRGSLRHADWLLRFDAAYEADNQVPPRSGGMDAKRRALWDSMPPDEIDVIQQLGSILTGIEARAAHRAALPLPDDVCVSEAHLLRTHCTCEDKRSGATRDDLARTIIACRQCGRLVDAQFGAALTVNVEQLMVLTPSELRVVINAGVVLVNTADDGHNSTYFDPPAIQVIDDDGTLRIVKQQLLTVGELFGGRDST